MIAPFENTTKGKFYFADLSENSKRKIREKEDLDGSSDIMLINV
jgi:hypothetical protein